MKKMLNALLGAMLLANISTAFAETTKQPMSILQVEDVSTKVPKLVNGLKLSLSKPHRLCWYATNIPFQISNTVIEVFEAPEATSFTSPIGNSVASEDKKTFTITTLMKNPNTDYLMQCWTFQENEPKGKYRFQLRVNDIQFPPQAFELVK